jgi:hypothetical protein
LTTIEGHLGQRDPLISILKTALQPSTKHRKRGKTEIAAIERFKQANGSHVYLMTPIPPAIARHAEKLKAYLDDNRRTKGQYLPTDHQWQQGSKYSGNKDTNPQARATAIPDYTNEISGNLDHKTPKRIRYIIRQGEAANIEFLNDLMP